MDQSANGPAGALESPILGRSLRVTASIHLVTLFAQVGLTFFFLAGRAQALVLHRENARILLGLGILLALVALAHGVRRTGRWLTLIAVSIPALEATQLWLAQSGQVPLHVLTGLLIWSLSIAFTVKVWATVHPV